ncbi:hypothetical protein BH09PAT2_BH09PAT2_06960 [soil metagenome]
MKTLLLIDGHAMIHRAYHALPDTMVSSKGIPTNAIYGFFMMLQKVLTEFRPSHLAVCFDTPKPTFRKELFKDYQSKRPAMETTLKVQIPEIKTLLTQGGILCLEKPGFEADDVIGTVAEKEKASFDRVLILTGDRDLLQLTDDKVYVITPKKGVSEFSLYTPENVTAKFGVPALNIPDFKALAGDASDNYNTAKGIGPKTACKLLALYPTVEELLEHIDQVDNEKWRNTLTEYKDTILLFKKIATIVRDVDVTTTEAELEFTGFKEPMTTELRRLELYSIQTKLFPKPPTEKPVKEVIKKKEEKPTDQIDLFS